MVAPFAGSSNRGQQGGEEGVNWGRYVSAVLRYKWLILATTLLGSAGGFGATRFLKPLYVAQASIWIERSEGTRGGGGSESGPIRAGSLILANDQWIELLKSYVVLDEVVRRLRLQVQAVGDPAVFKSFQLSDSFVPGQYRLSVDAARQGMVLTRREGPSQQAKVGESIGSLFGFVWTPSAEHLTSGAEIEFTIVPPRDAARALGEGLHARAARDGNFLTVELSGVNPQAITDAVNAVVERHVEVAAELKREKVSELVRVLRDQLERSGRDLNNAELALQEFQVKTITMPSEKATPLAPGLAVTRDPVMEHFFNMKNEQEQLSRDRETILRILDQAGDSALASTALQAVASVENAPLLSSALDELVNKSAELRALRSKYTEEHLPVIRLVEEVQTLSKTTIPALARQYARELADREADVTRNIASASTELRQIPPRAIEEQRLERNVEIADDLYTKLQSRFEEARLAEASAVADVRVLSAAVVPQRPVQNRTALLIAGGLFAGLGLGVMMAVVLDRVDRRVRYPEQVTGELGLPILGVIPHISSNGKGAQDSAEVIEALRGVRLNLIHAIGTAGPLMVTVTSPGSGDGKSFLAANLALSFADAGYPTLLVDGDARRGSLHRLLGVERKPGLTDLLAGTAPEPNVIRETRFRGLSFIPCGTRSAQAPELLGSSGLTQLVLRLRSRFKVIVIDSPPLGAGVDAFALGTAAGAMILVLRTGITNRDLAEAKLDVLDRLPVRMLGAVLNGVRESNAYRYYSYYLPGYEIAEETEGTKPNLIQGAS